MIKNFVPALAVVCALCGCSKEIPVQNQVKEVERTTIQFTIPTSETKLLQPYAENVVKSLQVFVFNPDGTLDAAGSSTTNSVPITCTTGEKDVFAIVNAKPFTNIFTKAALFNQKTLLSENSVSKLVMEGYTKVNVVPNCSVNIPVYRNVARVSLQGIKAAYTSDMYKDQEFRILKVFMINVAADKWVGESSETGQNRYFTLWNHKMGLTSPVPSLYDEVSNALVTAASPYTTKHYFYVYPNPYVEDANGGAWSPRHTKLVVMAKIGELICYYPVTLPPIARNTCYDITLTATRPGSLDPDMPISKADASFKIEVKPWEQSAPIEQII